MQQVAAVFVPVAPLRGVSQTEDQLEGLNSQFNTGRAGGNGRGRGGRGVGGVSSLVKEQVQRVQQLSDSLICSCRQLLQSSGYVVHIICI